MLRQILDDTMQKASKYEKMVQPSRITNVFGDVEIEPVQQESLMQQKISKYIKKGYKNDKVSEENDFIVENPEEAILNIKYTPTNLPFFKSITSKLNKVIVNIK